MTKGKEEQKRTPPLASPSLKDLLYMLDLWRGEGEKRREKERQLAKEKPIEASIEGMIAVIFERHVIEVETLMGKQV